MDDKTLLELAGRAQGWFDYPTDSVEAGSMWHTDKDKAPFDHSFSKASWNPLTDDGDALRLAVKLRMSITVSELDSMATAYAEGFVQGYSVDFMYDVNSAVRLAIVRAAAEVGKEMLTPDEFILMFPGRFDDWLVAAAIAEQGEKE